MPLPLPTDAYLKRGSRHVEIIPNLDDNGAPVPMPGAIRLRVLANLGSYVSSRYTITVGP